MKGTLKLLKGCYCKSRMAVAFGIGLVLASFCPLKVTLCITGILIAALGITVANCCGGKVCKSSF